jgi:hypothetical protein
MTRRSAEFKVIPIEIIAIEDYIQSKISWELCRLGAGLSVITIGSPPGSMAKFEPEAKRLNAKLWSAPAEVQHDFIAGWAKTLGKKFPLLHVGCGENPTLFIIRYGDVPVSLDFSDPNFFTELDHLLTWVMTHDSLEGYSLGPLGEDWSDPS